MDNEPKSFGDVLRRTTSKPLFLHPLMWSPDHLKFLRLSMVYPPDIPKAQPSQRKKRLRTGTIDLDTLEVVWFWGQLGMCKVDYYLPDVIISVIYSVQKRITENLFELHVKSDEQSASLRFEFSTTHENIYPEIFLTTATSVPFPIYSGPRFKAKMRHELSSTTRPHFWKILRDIESTSFDETIDPFDVACLIAMAQYQKYKLSYYPGSPDIDMFKVYLLSPAPTSVVLKLFTTHISKNYLDALENPNLEVTDRLIITKEIIDLPNDDIYPVNLSEGALVDKLGEILEEVCGHNETLLRGLRKKQAMAEFNAE